MPKYRVATLARPTGWKHKSLDDVPPEPAGALMVSPTDSDLFSAAKQATELNAGTEKSGGDRWAVVVDIETVGRRFPTARLCTPITYKVTSIWRPDGWEPASALDVPNCVWRTQSELHAEPMTYAKALDTVRTLNQQSIDQATTTWYVLVAVEAEPVSQTVSYDPTGTETTTETRRLYVVRPDHAGHGDCSHCPAHAFPCAMASWTVRPEIGVQQDVRRLPR